MSVDDSQLKKSQGSRRPAGKAKRGWGACPIPALSFSPSEGRVYSRQLVLRNFQIRLERSAKHRFEALLLVLVVNQHHRRHAHRLLALAAGGRFALQILHEAISEVISRARAPR